MASTTDYRNNLSILLLTCLVPFGGDIDYSLPWITWMQILFSELGDGSKDKSCRQWRLVLHSHHESAMAPGSRFSTDNLCSAMHYHLQGS